MAGIWKKGSPWVCSIPAVLKQETNPWDHQVHYLLYFYGISNLQKSYRNSTRNPEYALPRFSSCLPFIPSLSHSLSHSPSLSFTLPASYHVKINTCSITSKYLGVFSLRHLLLNYRNHTRVIKIRTFNTDILLSTSQKNSNVRCLSNTIYRGLSSSA